MEGSRISQAVRLLSKRIADAVTLIGIKDSIQEIRLRRGGYLSVTVSGREYFVSFDGRLKERPDTAVEIFDEDIESAYRSALKNSLHSFENEIRQGFVTSDGGNRVGFCGRAVSADTLSGTISTVRDIISVNIRIASQLTGCSDDIYERVFADGLHSLVIAGPPASGKTTVLRDLCRRLSGYYRISLADERGEIAAVSDGRAFNDVGFRTDIFTGYPRSCAIMTAVRVMSPQILICDETGSPEELAAYRYAVGSGVRLILTCHASCFADLMKRPVISDLIAEDSIEKAVILGTGDHVGKLLSVHSLGEKQCSDCLVV